MQCLFDTQFDYVISLGENCGGAMHLSYNGLRKEPFPLDWIKGPSFEERVELILNHFSGFLEIENLKPAPMYETSAKHAGVIDTNTGFIFLHDFASDASLRDFSEIKNKYNQRITKLYEKVEKTPSVLFIWFGKESNEPNEVLTKGREKLSMFFHKEIYILAFQNNKDIETPYCEQISPFLIRYSFDFKDDPNSEDAWMGDPQLFRSILSKVVLKNEYDI